MTTNNLVFCNIMKSKLPDILTTPFILISPTSGKSLSKAKPGRRGESSTNARRFAIEDTQRKLIKSSIYAIVGV